MAALPGDYLWFFVPFASAVWNRSLPLQNEQTPAAFCCAAYAYAYAC
jgi:hypothetical protein